MRNTPLSSAYPVSAVEVDERREGVCRDLAHIGIALCRVLCVPARLVVGYLHGLEPMDIHAWYQVFVGGKGWTFDPTGPQSSARITIAHGRDATDVAIYNQFGPLLLPRSMRVIVEPSGPPASMSFLPSGDTPLIEGAVEHRIPQRELKSKE